MAGVTRIVLLGAGHAHVEVLRQFAARPVAGVHLTLIAAEAMAPYSGMLPGLIRGEYSTAQAHIDAAALARAAGAAFMLATAAQIDLAARMVAGVGFDLLSINVGGVPQTGAGGIGVKPVGAFLETLAALDSRMPAGVAVVGGGAGGCELALALAARWGRVARLTLVARGAELLPAAPPRARRLVGEALAAAGVTLLLGGAAGMHDGAALHLPGGGAVPCAAALWATGVVAPAFLAASGLACDARGAVQVDAALGSVSHPYVFAAGDCAAFIGQPLPQSGVWAVRAGPVLATNLRRAATGQPPAPWQPQRDALAILGLGHGQAVAWRNGVTLSGGLAWRWKDRIDRAWMRRYQEAG